MPRCRMQGGAGDTLERSLTSFLDDSFSGEVGMQQDLGELPAGTGPEAAAFGNAPEASGFANEPSRFGNAMLSEAWLNDAAGASACAKAGSSGYEKWLSEPISQDPDHLCGKLLHMPHPPASL
jgi:hypothetical protein